MLSFASIGKYTVHVMFKYSSKYKNLFLKIWDKTNLLAREKFGLMSGPEPLDPEPASLEGEAKGAEMQLPGPLGVRGGVGLPGTGLCWKLDSPPPPRGDTDGTSVLTPPPPL